MDLLLSSIGIIFLLAFLAGVIFFALFMAKKAGLIKPLENSENASGESTIQIYARHVRKLNDSLIFRFTLIALLVGLMNIPLGMVEEIVDERNVLYHSVLSDISDTWGKQQALLGPALLIPYTDKITTVRTLTDKDGNERKVNKTNYYERTAILLPEDLNIDVQLLNQSRKRGLYDAQVYNATLDITGKFERPNITKLSSNIDQIHWNRAWLTLGITDTQAINRVSHLNWGKDINNARKIDFEPGTKIVKTIANGFHAPMDLTAEKDQTPYNFSLQMNVNGSKGFYFSPFGKVTDVTIKSDWPHPSFQGSVLPNTRQISQEGFTAYWSIPNLARNYPQLWTLNSETYDINESVAGVNIFESISLYSKITRAIKYGSLFFILTYITFLIFEMSINKRLHIVQYGMIGLALSMFYLTLLSAAEHFGFFKAYLSAASIIVVMVSLYSYSAIRSMPRTSIIALLLTGLYVMLYSVLKLEESALMSGTLLLLLILAVMMYMTRNIGKQS